MAEYRKIPVENVEEFFEVANLNVRTSVYNQFYAWLEKTHGLKDALQKGLPPSMHRRCFVPKSFMKKMDKLEATRIRKVNGVNAADAKKQAVFSNGNTGPRESKRGEGAYVINGEDLQ